MVCRSARLASILARGLRHDQRKSGHITLADGDMHERGKSFASRGTEYNGALTFNSCKHGYQFDLKRPLIGFTTCKQPSNLMLLNTCMVSRRLFASRTRGGNEDDEHVLDDVEARLMRDDHEGDDNYMGDSSYGMDSANFDDYEVYTKDEDYSEVGEGEGDSNEEGADGDSDGDSDEDSFNEQSDEEFEDEQTDEEFDELLANTPLFDPPELVEDFRPDEPIPEFSFRPEGPFYYPGMEYEPEELDVTRPLPIRKREIRPKEEISVQEVIDNADFRNVRYLTKFISESGNILARKEFKMRTKSHNRIVKAIKTARFFGLMPYTNMGRPKFVFNEPFDEFSEFYETDEDEKMFDNVPTENTYYQRGFGNSGRGNGGYGGQFGQGQGGFGSQNTWRRL